MSSGVVWSTRLVSLMSAPPSSSARRGLDVALSRRVVQRREVRRLHRPFRRSPPRRRSACRLLRSPARSPLGASPRRARPESIAAWICAGVNGPLGCGPPASAATTRRRRHPRRRELRRRPRRRASAPPRIEIGAAPAALLPPRRPNRLRACGMNEMSTSLRFFVAACSRAASSVRFTTFVAERSDRRRLREQRLDRRRAIVLGGEE